MGVFLQITGTQQDYSLYSRPPSGAFMKNWGDAARDSLGKRNCRENWNLDSFLSSSVFSSGFHQFCTVHLATLSFILFSPEQIQWNKLSWYLWNASCYGFISVVVFSLFTSTLPLLMSLAAALLPLMLTSPGHRLYLLHCMHVGTGLYVIVSQLAFKCYCDKLNS